MRLSDRYEVPPGAALLYDFANTLDERRYVVDHMRLTGGDAIETPARLGAWFKQHDLSEHVDAGAWHDAVALRNALRSYLKLPPSERRAAAPALDTAASIYGLRVETDAEGRVNLIPQAGADTLGMVLVQFHLLAITGQLDRLRQPSKDASVSRAPKPAERILRLAHQDLPIRYPFPNLADWRQAALGGGSRRADITSEVPPWTLTTDLKIPGAPISSRTATASRDFRRSNPQRTDQIQIRGKGKIRQNTVVPQLRRNQRAKSSCRVTTPPPLRA